MLSAPTAPHRMLGALLVLGGLSLAAADVTWSEHEITSAAYGGADGACSVVAIDLDGDGDMDVVAGSANDDTAAWYENLSLIHI